MNKLPPIMLKANFEADLIAYARGQLIVRYGKKKISRIEDKNILIYFFDSQRRALATRPRDVKTADNFKCPSDRQSGWAALRDKVLRGEDLNPHLSERHQNLRNRDGLLNEWGVHHFHLGVEPLPSNPKYVKRSVPVVYALVDEITFYAVNVYDHEAWEETSIIESLHRNWPDAISKYRLSAITGETLTKQERRGLRKNHGNVAVTTIDGTVYGPIGGGVAAAGTSIESVMMADRWMNDIRRLQSDFRNEVWKLMPEFYRAGYAGEPELEAELRILGIGDYQVFFPRYNILATIQTSV